MRSDLGTRRSTWHCVVWVEVHGVRPNALLECGWLTSASSSSTLAVRVWTCTQIQRDIDCQRWSRVRGEG